MANLYQCKCGAPLEVSHDGKTGTCPFCGATVVFPKAGFQRMNKANELRQRREFDQAEGIYRSLTIAFPDDPEIWWNILLCEYGIEYVEEIKNGVKKSIPTINRMKYESIFEQEGYEKAVALADEETKAVYEAEAQRIEDIQHRLQEIVAKEEKYDIFISFKDKDDVTGERTLDSALAQEIYDALTKEGYKVFFSRITLRRMVGQEFEPKIFAALNSAAMMIVVGCKKEHIEATWVKNEWSRYLKLMEKDADKFLLPVYAEMKPDDLPKKMRPLEGIEANGINYMKLIVKNVGERIGYKKAQYAEEKIVQNVEILEQDEVRRLTERGYNAIKNGRSAQADDYFEQALDINMKYALAWWGKLVVASDDFTCTKEILKDEQMKRFYQQAMQNASEKEKARFDADMERHKQKLRKYRGEVLLGQFLDKTKNWSVVYVEGDLKPNASHNNLVKLQTEILECFDGDERKSLEERFDAYNDKRDRVEHLKAEYLGVEHQNKILKENYARMCKRLNGDRSTLDFARTENRKGIWTIGLVVLGYLNIVWTYTDFSEELYITYALLALCAYKVWKKTKGRNKDAGGSYRGLEKCIKRQKTEVEDMRKQILNRIAQLPDIYKELGAKYTDVEDYIIPKDINGHVAAWKTEMFRQV